MVLCGLFAWGLFFLSSVVSFITFSSVERFVETSFGYVPSVAPPEKMPASVVRVTNSSLWQNPTCAFRVI